MWTTPVFRWAMAFIFFLFAVILLFGGNAKSQELRPIQATVFCDTVDTVPGIMNENGYTLVYDLDFNELLLLDPNPTVDHVHIYARASESEYVIVQFKDGCYSNLFPLPREALDEMLRERGIEPEQNTLRNRTPGFIGQLG